MMELRDYQIEISNKAVKILRVKRIVILVQRLELAKL